MLNPKNVLNHNVGQQAVNQWIEMQKLNSEER